MTGAFAALWLYQVQLLNGEPPPTPALFSSLVGAFGRVIRRGPAFAGFFYWLTTTN